MLQIQWIPRRSYRSRSSDFPGLRDPEDAHVLSAAMAAGCDFLVTGDKDLLLVGKVGTVRIVSPAAAWEILQRPRNE